MNDIQPLRGWGEFCHYPGFHPGLIIFNPFRVFRGSELPGFIERLSQNGNTFNKLAKNEPMEAFEKKFVRLTYDQEPEIYKLESVHKADARNKVMFVSDGTDIYMHSSRYCYHKHFVKAKQFGRYFYFEDQFSDAEATLAFGLLGAAASSKMRSIILDTSNGEVSILNDNLVQKISAAYPSIFMEYKNSKQKLRDKEELIKKLNEAMNQQ
jgi:hypothetical protein